MGISLAYNGDMTGVSENRVYHQNSCFNGEKHDLPLDGMGYPIFRQTQMRCPLSESSLSAVLMHWQHSERQSLLDGLEP